MLLFFFLQLLNIFKIKAKKVLGLTISLKREGERQKNEKVEQHPVKAHSA